MKKGLEWMGKFTRKKKMITGWKDRGDSTMKVLKEGKKYRKKKMNERRRKKKYNVGLKRREK